MHVGYVHISPIFSRRFNLHWNGHKLLYKDGDKIMKLKLQSKYIDAIKKGKWLRITLSSSLVEICDPY